MDGDPSDSKSDKRIIPFKCIPPYAIRLPLIPVAFRLSLKRSGKIVACVSCSSCNIIRFPRHRTSSRGNANGERAWNGEVHFVSVFEGVSSTPVLRTNRLHVKLEKSYFAEDLLALSCSSMSLVPEPSLVLSRSLRGTSSLSTSRVVSSEITFVTEIQTADNTRETKADRKQKH